jgi:hypothetical protein
LQQASTWLPDTQSCTGVVDGVHLRVLTTDVGSVSSPITKVIGAELEISTRRVKAARCPFGTAPCETSFTVSATTSFVKRNSASYTFVPESPNIIPPLPYDFFYPFFMSSNPA